MRWDTSSRASTRHVPLVYEEGGEDEPQLPGNELTNGSISAMEIVTKLCDVDFARKAKAADFLGRAWEVLREAGAGDGDKVSRAGPRDILHSQCVPPIGPGHHFVFLRGIGSQGFNSLIRLGLQIRFCRHPPPHARHP